MKKLKTNRGFTLIELLVVVFIIGILTAFIVVNISSARNKSLDKSVQSNLESVRARAEITYDNDANANSYATVCADSAVAKSIQQAANATRATGTFCANATDTWVAWAPLAQGGFWCVDNKRTSSAYTANTALPTSSSTQCPTSGQTTLGGNSGNTGNNGSGNNLIPININDNLELQEGEINQLEFQQNVNGLEGEQLQQFESF